VISIAGINMTVRARSSRSIQARSSADPGGRGLVMDIIARDDEQARNPEDHEGDMRRLDPQISGAKEADIIA
jgi:hypothetical protein